VVTNAIPEFGDLSPIAILCLAAIMILCGRRSGRKRIGTGP
jgi:hypothetical protein